MEHVRPAPFHPARLVSPQALAGPGVPEPDPGAGVRPLGQGPDDAASLQI